MAETCSLLASGLMGEKMQSFCVFAELHGIKVVLDEVVVSGPKTQFFIILLAVDPQEFTRVQEWLSRERCDYRVADGRGARDSTH